jgi:hypothetical protein
MNPIVATKPQTPEDNAGWRWPQLKGTRTLGPLQTASFIEWRYYAVLSQTFHGIVGLALVNPEARFRFAAESGLLLMVAGVLDRAEPPATSAAMAPRLPDPSPAALCWMHLFPGDACIFDDPSPGSLKAGDADCCVAVTHDGPAAAEIQVEANAGLHLQLSHLGLTGTALPATASRDFSGPFGGGWVGDRWTVDCPSPVATTSGRLHLDEGLVVPLAEGPGATPSYATPALRAALARGRSQWSWQAAAGYYEHSWGVRPLPLHGWDFLFAPDVETASAVVLQTYRGSRSLRYLDVCWRQGGAQRQRRFGAEALALEWTGSIDDPVLGVRRPLARRIEAAADGLRLVVENRVLHGLPLLRRGRLPVRHFFIYEEIGIADWTLTTTAGEVLAAARDQPCGGELAHFRRRAPRLG